MVTPSNLAFVPRASFPAYCATKALLHSWLQSLRQHLRNTPVEVPELAPPHVQTELSGRHQALAPRAMPLEPHVAEAMDLLAAHDHPDREVMAERAQAERWAERWAERNGRHGAVLPRLIRSERRKG